MRTGLPAFPPLGFDLVLVRHLMTTTCLVVDPASGHDAAQSLEGHFVASVLAGEGVPAACTTYVSTQGASASLRELSQCARATAGEALVVADASLIAHSTPVADVVSDPHRSGAVLLADAARVDVARVDVAPPGAGPALGSAVLAIVQGGVLTDVALTDATAGATARTAGLFRLPGKDRKQAADAWSQAASDIDRLGTPEGFVAGTFVDLALRALVRSGVRVTPISPAPFVARRVNTAAEVAVAVAAIDVIDEPSQRLRRASRPRDGFFSTFAIRPVSRRVTAIALRLRWKPNPITVGSLVVGLASAAAFATGQRGWLIVGAVLLQMSLVLDCVDGEVARYTRQFSALGAWLDAVFDRLKEYLVYAGLAIGAMRTGDDVWALAVAALSLLVFRHTVDLGFSVRNSDLAHVELLPRALHDPPDHGAPHDVDADTATRVSASATALSERTSQSAGLMWAKRAIIMPIGERWLVISLLAAFSGARAVFVALLVLGAIAAAYTTTGRILRSMGNHRRLSPVATQQMRELGDFGPLAQTLCAKPLTPVLEGRFGWLLPALSRAIEYGVVTLFVVGGRLSGPLGYALLAAVAYHHYDTVYRQRNIGVGPGRLTTGLLLGADGRLLVVVVAVLVLPTPTTAVLALALWVSVIAVSESVWSWTRWLRGAAVVIAEDEEVTA